MSNHPYRNRETYLQKRAHSFGMTMMVMGACFLFYYLGLFGGVKGPLSPESMGTWLADRGVGRDHITWAVLGFFILSLVWNHLVNLFCFFAGGRRTRVQGNVRFHPVKKGIFAHTVWITALLCSLILLFYR